MDFVQALNKNKMFTAVNKRISILTKNISRKLRYFLSQQYDESWVFFAKFWLSRVQYTKKNFKYYIFFIQNKKIH